MTVQGLDRAQAPAATFAKRMLDQIGGRWWNVYIGGPKSAGEGWTPSLLAQYVDEGIDRFMLTYVGRQKGGPLTRSQGQADARDALAIAKRFGYVGSFPLCLDVEMGTFTSAPEDTVKYTRAWCATVGKEGARPGVYANASPLIAMAKAKVPAEFVWVASWLDHRPAKHDAHAIPNFPADLWPERGARAWQYAGAFDGKPCRVLGLDVDISVSDLGCLARAPGLAESADVAVVESLPALRRGARGPEVRRLTQRLSFVRSRSTRAPYLDGARDQFDRETELALKAFQREHDLATDGTFTKTTERRLQRAVAREKQRREEVIIRAPGETGANAAGSRGRKDLHGLVERVLATDKQHEAALEELLSYGLRRRLLIQRLEEAQATSTKGLLMEIIEVLRKIESDLNEPVNIAGDPSVTAVPAADDIVATAAQPDFAESSTRGQADALIPVEKATVPQIPGETLAPAATGESDSPLSQLVADVDEASLALMPDRALVRLIRNLDETLDLARSVLVRRFERYESEAARLQRGGAKVAPDKRRSEGGAAATDDSPGRRPGGTPGGSVVDIRLGDQAHLVRASKIALARFLSAKGNQEHAELRRALKRDARTRKQGEIATRIWEKGVRAAQHLSGRPATGVMDSELQQRLQAFWPSDSAVRRALRATPGWRIIPGQLSPNFNVREFACKDGTAYVGGLVREQGLSTAQAKRRATELAKRLERVRKAGNNRPLRPTSVYRTIAHNASLSGSATNSAHLRGFAADVPPPPGISLATHRKHVRAAFEAGVGLYPGDNFVHGDFDMSLGRREWQG